MYKRKTPPFDGVVRSDAGEPFPTASSSHAHWSGM